MFDLFGSKNLLAILSPLIEESSINNIVVSSSLESQFATSTSPSNIRMKNLPEESHNIIEADLRKTFRLNNNRGNILIADFLSERNNIARYNNSKITLNSEVKSYVGNDSTQNIILDSRVKSIPTLIENFIDIADKYDKVIICELYLTNHNIDDNNMLNLNSNQYGINKVNALLKTFYEHLKFQRSDYTYIQIEDSFSQLNKSRVSPWIYSDITINSITKKINNILN